MSVLHRSAVVAAVLLLAACQSTTVDTAPRIALPQTFEHTQAAMGGADIRAWWQNWQDPVLNQLIERALSDNLDIQTAQSRLNESRAVARLARADLRPQAGIGVNASAVRGQIDNPLAADARNTLGAIPPVSELGSEQFDIEGNLFSGSLSASWEPDLFGKKSSDADAALAGAQAQLQQLYGVQLLTAADVADRYFQARALQKNLAAAQADTAALQQMLRYINGRFGAGHVSKHEVNEAAAALQSAQAKQHTLQMQFDAQVRAIAVLSGQIPQHFRLPESETDILAQAAAAPSGATPQGLIERRPDLRARAAAVNARAAKLASAKADLYPRFSIHFLGQGNRIEIDSAEPIKGWANLISVGITMPLFSAGRIKHNIAAADARLQTALLEYDQNLLTALSEVDNAYQAYGSLNRQTEQMAQARDLYRQRAADADKLFRYGEKTLDTAIRARIDSNQAAERLTAAQLARAQALLGIYKALGGGW